MGQICPVLCNGILYFLSFYVRLRIYHFREAYFAMKEEKSLKTIFVDDPSVRRFLLSVLITGLSYGLYKGMLDNYLAEVVLMGEMDRGITEFFRELPGIALVFILAAFYMLSAQAMYKIGAAIMLVGMLMHAVLPPDKVLITIAICVYSLGEHIQLGMKSTLSLH